MGTIYFGTDGWRGVVGRDFTRDKVKLVAQAVADYLGEHSLSGKGVVVGYDTRKSSRRFAGDVSRVMAGNGVTVYMTERDTPTPVVAFEVLQRRAGGAVVITASHNPAEWNGIKFIPHYAGPALPDVTDQLTRRVNAPLTGKAAKAASAKHGKVKKLVQLVEPLDAYAAFVERQVDLEAIRAARLKMVCDTMHGTARGYLDRVLRDAGCVVELLHAQPDPEFGGHRPEPVLELLTELQDRVQASGADLGFATDGDADRLAVIDNDGTYLAANELAPVLLEHMLNTGRKGGVVRSVATTHLVDRIAHSRGMPAYEVPVGFKYVAQCLRERDVVLGVEESGGFSFKGHISEKDGILTCLMVAEARALANRPLHVLLEGLCREHGRHVSGRTSAGWSPADASVSLVRLASSPPAEVAGVKVAGVNTLDGVKLLLEDGSWLLIRPSGTEPVVRIYGEARDQSQLGAILAAGETLIKP